MMHVPQGATDAKDTLKRYLSVMPATDEIVTESRELHGGFDMASYSFLLVYDRYPKTFRKEYTDAPIDTQRKLEVLFRAMCNAKQFGVHNMLKVTAFNFRAHKKRVYTYQEEVKAYNKELKYKYDAALEDARKDGQTQRRAQLIASSPAYMNTTPTVQNVIDKDFEPADLQIIISESGLSAVLNADGLTRQLGVVTAIIAPCRPEDPGGYEHKLEGIMADLDENTVGMRRGDLSTSGDAIAAYQALLIGVTGGVDYDDKRIIIRTSLPNGPRRDYRNTGAMEIKSGTSAVGGRMDAYERNLCGSDKSPPGRREVFQQRTGHHGIGRQRYLQDHSGTWT